jgi:hypothetical protein
MINKREQKQEEGKGKLYLYIYHGGAWGNGGLAPLILNFRIILKRVVSLMPRPIYQQERPPISTEYDDGRLPEAVRTF